MPNIAEVLKQEIGRLARKEVKASCAPLQNQIRELRKTVSAQKQTIAQLEKAIAQLAALPADGGQPIQVAAEAEQVKVRLSPASIKRIRNRFKISQGQLAQLLDVSTNTIVRWEAGTSVPRARYKQALGKLRGLGKREIKKQLEAGQAKE
ncbi:MAG: helix-turn-helix domain-containing protein [Gemmatimonadetes bacterium]|jgi:DNA-binding transcriptional regulator YiaG|nr:helix-turn-helix domain-containing protein [Gemmatimonadota bacterium]